MSERNSEISVKSIRLRNNALCLIENSEEEFDFGLLCLTFHSYSGGFKLL